MAKGNMNKTEKNKKSYHSMKAYNLGDQYQQKLKSPPFGPHFIKFSKIVFYEARFFLVRKGESKFSLIMIPKTISFNAMVVLVLFFLIFLFGLPMAML